MTNKNEALHRMAERCEQASGPDRELDRDIGFAALGWKTYQHGEFSLICGHDGESWADHPGSTYTFFTASIDAALTLVPEGFQWLLEHMARTDKAILYSAQVASATSNKMRGDKVWWVATPALALCAAALRARASAASSPTAPEGE